MNYWQEEGSICHLLWFKHMTGLDLVSIRVAELLETTTVLDRKYHILSWFSSTKFLLFLSSNYPINGPQYPE